MANGKLSLGPRARVWIETEQGLIACEKNVGPVVIERSDRSISVLGQHMVSRKDRILVGDTTRESWTRRLLRWASALALGNL